jgi:hypothetical protein
MMCRINPKQRSIAMTAPLNPVDFFNRAYRLPISNQRVPHGDVGALQALNYPEQIE